MLPLLARRSGGVSWGTMRSPRRIVDFVGMWADRQPERVCLTFHPRVDSAAPVTYGDLWTEALAWARGLGALGLDPGAPVVVLARTSRAFVSMFLGLQQAGLLAVPCPPPEPLENGRSTRERVSHILDGCRASVVLDPEPGAGAQDLRADLTGRGVRVLDPTWIGEAAGSAAPPAGASPFAYCQFTSGSGGRAKGVRLTHENLLAFMRARTRAYGLGASDVGVSWLPFFHDMGLIGYVLHPLVDGVPVHLMSTAAFLARPSAWLGLITRVRGTFSVAPNSAYGLCARRVSDAELPALDLSGWRMAFNGSERVTRDVVDAFVDRFAAVGFRAAAMLPAYGLAENTLTACSRLPGEGARFEEVARDALERDGVARLARDGEEPQTMVSVGRPLGEQEIAIAGTDGARLPPRHVGEVLLRGPSVMHSYLPGTQGDASLRGDGWLATGDLGYLADGELFLVGRKKDLIIRAGRNYYPEDLETAAGRVPGVRAGRIAAFSVSGPEHERVVLAAETRADWDRDAAALRDQVGRAVFSAVRFQPDEIVLLAPNALPLTSSGKIMRPEARRLYDAGGWPPADRP